MKLNCIALLSIMFLSPPSLREYGEIEIYREFIKNPYTNEDIGEMIIEFDGKRVDFLMIKFGEYAIVDFTFEGERVKYISYRVAKLIDSIKPDKYLRRSL